ncbi:alpha-ketoglutarate-dependent dioxygenase AlkB family protein [Halioxenophilus aromaticivorans]|uniref:Fe2OG dioxygenase domain-containing protein n=1 Tax=Halioxenophilus aromaticivorans TaxID=1306992 RepID=A0AAV3U5Y3_9ALTE
MYLFTDIENPALPFTLPDEIDFLCRWDETLRAFCISVPGGELIYAEQFFDRKISDRSVEYFQENENFDWKEICWSDINESDLKKINFKNIKWKQDKIKLYGKTIPLPRLTCWHGDQGTPYTYSGITSQPNEWNKGLLYIKNKVEKIAHRKFNSVLLNWYRDGEDHLSWHADDEKELGSSPVIASVNFGETRDFILRRNSNKTQKITIPLKHGTLLIMAGALQHNWQHSVPKRKRIKNSRFNLTFRNIS